jgi:hypothetical protein
MVGGEDGTQEEQSAAGAEAQGETAANKVFFTRTLLLVACRNNIWTLSILFHIMQIGDAPNKISFPIWSTLNRYVYIDGTGPP